MCSHPHSHKRFPVLLLILTQFGLLFWSHLAAEPMVPQPNQGTHLRIALSGISGAEENRQERQHFDDLTLALQAILETDSSFEWVERSEIALTVSELALSLGGLTSTRDELRTGRWLNADILIRGFINSDSEEENLVFEIIDLKRADLLAEVRFPAPLETNRPIQLTSSYIENAASVIKKSLHSATEQLRNRREQTTIALLYCANLSDSARLASFKENLQQELLQATTADSSLHLLVFPRALEAAQESELVLGGLVDTDYGAWSSIADLYVWASFRELEVEEAEIAFSEIPVEIEFTVWDGATPAATHLRTTTVAALPGVATKLAKETTTHAREITPGVKPGEFARLQTARSLLERSREIQYQRFLLTPVGRQFFNYKIHLLETAAFFDPLNKEIHNELLESRWSTWNPLKPLETAEGHWLRFLQYREFAERFFEDGSFQHQHRLRALHQLQEAANSLRDLATHAPRQAFLYANHFLTTLGDEVTQLNQWANAEGRSGKHWIANYNERAFQIFFNLGGSRDSTDWSKADPAVRFEVIKRLWPYFETYAHALRDTDSESREFRQVTSTMISLYSLFGAEHEAIAMIAAKANSPEPLAPEATEPARPRRAAIIPSASDSSEDQNDDLVETHFGPELLADITELSISPNGETLLRRAPVADANENVNEGARYHSFAYHGQYLWISETDPLHKQHVWAYDPLTRELASLTEILGEHPPVLDLLIDGGNMWAALDGAGVWHIDLTPNVPEKTVVEEGLQSFSTRALAKAGNSLYVGGGRRGEPVLSRYDLSSREWHDLPLANLPEGRHQGISVRRGNHDMLLAATERLLFLFLGGNPFIFDRENASWTNVGLHYREAFRNSSLADPERLRRLEVTLKNMRSSGFPNPEGSRTACYLDEQGIWFGNTGGLIFLDPEAGAKSAFYDAIGHVTAITQAGDQLWIAVSNPLNAKKGNQSREPIDDTHILLLDKNSRTWKGHIKLPGARIEHLIQGPGVLWAVSDRILEIRLREGPPSVFAGEDPKLAWPSRASEDFRLHRAILHGNMSEARRLIENGEGINQALPDGRGPINLAAEAGNQALIQLLLEAGADSETTSIDGRFPLLIAVERGDQSVVEALLMHGAKTDHRPGSPLVVPAGGSMQHSTSKPDPHIQALIPPQQPTQLTAEILSSNAIRLTWKNQADNASRIEVMRLDQGNGAFHRTDVLPPDATEYIDTDFHSYLRRPSEHQYIISAVNGRNYGQVFLESEAPFDTSSWATVTLPEHDQEESFSHVTAIEAQSMLRNSQRQFHGHSESKTALMAASATGRRAIAELLLAQGAPTEQEDIFKNTALLLAAAGGHWDLAKLLIENGADLNACNTDGKTILDFAYDRRKDRPFLSYLLRQGADLNKAGRRTLLMKAANAGRLDDVKWFLEKGADPDVVDFFGETAFSLAYSQGNSEICEYLLETGYDPNRIIWGSNRPRRLGDVPMLRAIEQDDSDMVQQLLGKGYGANQEIDDISLLIRAVKADSASVTRTLLEQGADPGKRTRFDEELDIFVRSEEVRAVLKYFGRDAKKVIPLPTGWVQIHVGVPVYRPFGAPPELSAREAQLFEAAKTGDLSSVLSLLDEGISPDARNPEGWTPLIAALAENHEDVARALIDWGAELNLVTTAGSAPLTFAVATNDKDLVGYLLAYGADPNLRRDDASSPLHFSLTVDSEITELLLQRGALPNLRSGDTFPLMEAARRGNLNAVRLLLDYGAKTEARRTSGVSAYTSGDPIPGGPTAFLHAACSGNIEVLEYLISRGSDPHHETRDGANALLWASHCGHLPTVEFLLGLGQSHPRALETALEQGHFDVAEHLKNSD